METAALDYELPADRIVTSPAEPRDAAHLMIVDRAGGGIEDRFVRDLGSGSGPLRAGDLLVLNVTRVLPASFTVVRESTGGKAKGLYLGESNDAEGLTWRVMLEMRGTPRVGDRLTFPGQADYLELLESHGSGQWLARLQSAHDTLALLERVGTTPLPQYIRQARKQRGEAEVRPEDAQRYNTVFAADPGSVAAPTAALHFTPELLGAIDRLGVKRATLTLHVGLGTFAPVRAATLEEHAIHEEWIRIPAATIAALRKARARGGRIIPVGTTCVRALESLPNPLPNVGMDYTARTNLFIFPGQPPFPFRFTDALMTNFHLPRSTLLALVAALPGVGLDRLKTWYRHAIEHDYRFYSYGDAMLIV